MIKSFKCRDTQALFETGNRRVFSNFLSVANANSPCLIQPISTICAHHLPIAKNESQYSIYIKLPMPNRRPFLPALPTLFTHA